MEDKMIKLQTILCLLTLFFIGACLQPKHVEKQVINVVKQRGEVIKEYEKDETKYIIMKEGPIIKKYRASSYKRKGDFLRSTSGSVGAVIATEYAVDTTLQLCFGGTDGTASVPCSKLKNDPDMKPFITWDDK